MKDVSFDIEFNTVTRKAWYPLTILVGTIFATPTIGLDDTVSEKITELSINTVTGVLENCHCK